MSKSNIKNINTLNYKKKAYINYSLNQKKSILYRLKKSTMWWKFTKKNTYKFFFKTDNHLTYNLISFNKKKKSISFFSTPINNINLQQELFFFKKIKI